ncbi:MULTISPECIES: efflux RND transporter periplasmic adaptor subunit [Pelosinus]|uniref:Efflux transporter, RND family, MFP subunit n=1 Tax=Pelosinus fermentans B4 TaxID=1149862 RepID=I9L5Q7_9FIRM|nr:MULTISPECIES: efflux RND transporter periplasmic adaptor subunit [Pelosinus]EIW15556.1 efflux transporter, RND family, MFP subunit [Pelosinus fermentans B4]EIW26754.1 efflux transporter, RND family, MFP subunit [Pelosinus fermentans A11]OAM92301.1 efflux transporter, RND family, MFP subunit [Pelosinus fermentans DSM 17108]SDQ40123.1 RND family efflux transporter, MFP subunit [Pelosinus fermentans]
MKKLIQQYPLAVLLTALSFAVALLLAASHNNLFPFSLWNEHRVPQEPIHLTAVPLGSINKPVQIIRTGSVEHATSTPITADFSGLLSELYVAEGQAVKAGQPLLKIQASSASVVEQITEGPSEQTQSNYDNALKEYNRLQKLFELGAIPRRQVETAAARLQEAKENLSGTQNAMPPSSAIINGSATINAPIDGIVTGLSSSSGKAVQAGQQLLSLGSGQEVEVVIPLNQNDLYLVHLGTPAAIEVSDQRVGGQISSIYPRIEAEEVSAYLAHMKLAANPNGLLTFGMSVAIHIDTGKTAPVPAVPKASIFQDDQGRNLIYLAVNEKVLLQEISIGETIGDFTEITSDLPQQSMIITSNMDDIKNGDPITVVPQDAN